MATSEKKESKELSVRDRTFLDSIIAGESKRGSARLSGSCQTHACRLMNRLRPHLEKWLDEVGLSDEMLKLKLLGVIDGTETKIVSLKGEVEAKDLPSGVRRIGFGKVDKGKGNPKEYNTLVAIDVVSLSARAKGLDLAFKIKGMYAAEKHEITAGDEVTGFLREMEAKLAREGADSLA